MHAPRKVLLLLGMFSVLGLTPEQLLTGVLQSHFFCSSGCKSNTASQVTPDDIHMLNKNSLVLVTSSVINTEPATNRIISSGTSGTSRGKSENSQYSGQLRSHHSNYAFAASERRSINVETTWTRLFNKGADSWHGGNLGMTFKKFVQSSNTDANLNNLHSNTAPNHQRRKFKLKLKTATLGNVKMKNSTTQFSSLESSFETEGSLMWSYRGTNGLAAWGEIFPECHGDHQSPINIFPHFTTPVDFGPMVFINYHQVPQYTTITNDGRTVMVSVSTINPPRLTGGGLPGLYELVQYHLHWGHDQLEGSEHTIDTVRYPMEMHLVHYKLLYGSVDQALNYSDGVAVLAVLLRVSEKDNPALSQLVAGLASITAAGRSVKMISGYPLVTILPRDMRLYYRYYGSLTTPPCSQAVVWTVFDQAIHISHAQLSTFRNLLKDETGLSLQDNFRPTQLLNSRQVYRSASVVGDRSTRQ